MKKILKLLLIGIIFIPALWYLFTPGYYNMHDDLQVMRLFQMDKCLNDGQVPCRWSPDMAYGYGQAMFNFYSATPYYVGALFRILLPVGYLTTVKLLFLTSFVVGACGMYLLAREFWGKWGGLLSAVLYTYAPYHALDVYVRGALAESFALGLLPLLLYYLYRLIRKSKKKDIVGTSVVIALVLMTHNISTLLYAPISLVWVIFWLLKFKSKKGFRLVLYSGLLGAGLASFFIIPAVVEQSLIQTQHLTTGYSDYHAHFVTLSQLFIQRMWGDGPSIFGPYDNLSFQVGWPHWWVGTIVAIYGFILLIKKRDKTLPLILLALLALFLGVTFLTHPRSLFVWEVLPFINFVQFPWRFLGLSIFFLSFAGGAFALINIGFKRLILLLIIFLTIILNYKYFVPVHYSLLITDEQKLTGVAFELQQKAAILDYLPKTAEIAPQDTAPSNPDIISGKGVVTGFLRGSNRFSFDAEIFKSAEVVIPVMYFPNWTVLIDGKKTDFEIFGAHGVMKVSIPDGKHIIRGRLINTPVRLVGNAISFVSLFVLLVILAVADKKKNAKTN